MKELEIIQLAKHLEILESEKNKTFIEKAKLIYETYIEPIKDINKMDYNKREDHLVKLSKTINDLHNLSHNFLYEAVQEKDKIITELTSEIKKLIK